MVGAVRAAAARVREEVGTALVVVARVAVVRGREEEVRAVTVVEMERWRGGRRKRRRLRQRCSGRRC